MPKVTIEDISRLTGFSRGTISRALNNRPDISEQTKERVLEACRQLNYVPSHAARSLATGRNYAAAVIVDDLNDPLSRNYLRGALNHAAQERYFLHVLEIANGDPGGDERLRTLAFERIDCALLLSKLHSTLVDPFREAISGRALVSTHEIPGISCDVLAPDLREAGRLAARYLLQRGPTPIRYLFAEEQPGVGELVQGFQEACGTLGVDPASALVALPAARGPRDRVPAIRAALDGAQGIAASSDALAIEALLVAGEAGRAAGQDLAVIGLGNEPLCAELQPSLTTIDLGGEEIGQRAMELALGRVWHTRMDAPQQAFVAPRLIERESTRMLNRPMSA